MLTPHRSRRGFTLIELLVVIAIISLLISILLPGLRDAREQAKRAKCGASLYGIGQGLQTCFTENNGFGPGWDDGEPGPPANHQAYMYGWIDVLFDNGYVGDPRVQICPTDRRPDEPTERRGRGGVAGWAGDYKFVEHQGVGEQWKYGVRTSYAQNGNLHYNFPRDFHKDGSRQVYAIDGWWTWFGSLNAAWVMAPRVIGVAPDPIGWPLSGASMVGWRHGRSLSANALFVDGHVSTITPTVPTNQTDLLRRTVDTAKYFTLLPGEGSVRAWTEYYGSGFNAGGGSDPIDERDSYASTPEISGGDVRPWRVFPNWKRARESNSGKFVAGAGTEHFVPYAYPNDLNPAWKTINNAWRKLPNRQTDRD
ncbi:MAG: type II secretion system protein [Phycisphaerae bacterium]